MVVIPQEMLLKMDRMQACVRSLLLSIQEDPSRQGLLDTPKRVAKALLAMTEGYRQDPALLLQSALFDEPDIQEGVGGLVLVRDIDFASLSQDTLLPFYGRCHIAYVPSNGVVLGLSKLARLTKLCAKQLQTQDSLARLLLHVLQKQLQPVGALVVIEAQHLDYTAVHPPQQQVSAAASGCLAMTAELQQSAAGKANYGGNGATLAEALELLGVHLRPAQLQLLPDAANPLCLLHPGCGCGGYGTLTAQPTLHNPHAELGNLQLLTAPACASCGSTRLAPHVLRGISASAGGMDAPDSPKAPVTPDPSENSDTDGSEQGSDLYCVSLLASSGDMRSADGDAFSLSGYTAAAAGEQQQFGSTVSMEAVLMQLLAEAGVDATSSTAQAAVRRHVLALLAATSGYHQEQPSRPVRAPCSSGSCCHSNWRQQQQEQPLFLPALQSTAGSSSSSSSVAAVQDEQQLQQYEHHIPFISQCEHHMLPFHGTLHISYLLPGSSSSSNSCRGCQSQEQQPLSRAEAEQLVQCYTRRLQVQERITHQVAAAVQRLLQPVGVMVVVQAVHMCMVARGVENHAGSTLTRAAFGIYESQPQRRCEFLRSVQQQKQQPKKQQEQKQAGHVGASSTCA